MILELINERSGIVTNITCNNLMLYSGTEYSFDMQEEVIPCVFRQNIESDKDILLVGQQDGVGINILVRPPQDDSEMEFCNSFECYSHAVLDLILTVKTLNNLTYIENHKRYLEIGENSSSTVLNIGIIRRTIDVSVLRIVVMLKNTPRPNQYQLTSFLTVQGTYGVYCASCKKKLTRCDSSKK